MGLKKIVTNQAMQLEIADMTKSFIIDPRKVIARRLYWSVC